MKLDWPEFQLECADDGLLTFVWRRFGEIVSHVRHCASVRLVPQGADGACQWIFQLRQPEPPTPGLVVVRVDVPPDRASEAEEYTELLRRRFRIPERLDDTEEDAGLERVPAGSRDWIVAPASDASEELFRDVMDRIAADPG